jgi:putative ABC transport system permease protein
MFKNYLKMAVRRLFRHKIFFSINVFGLAIGMTCSLLIMLYVAKELSFDRFHVGADRIFRICMTGRIGGKDFHVARSVRPMASTLVNEFPEVEQATRINPLPIVSVRVGNQNYVEKQILFVDDNFFSMFNFELSEGDVRSVLAAPASAVLTEETCRKYFGTLQAIGKSFEVESHSYKVAGIAKNPTQNSHFHFGILLPMSSDPSITRRAKDWGDNYLLTYIKLKKGVSSQDLEAKFPEMIKNHVGPVILAATGGSFEEFERQGNAYKIHLQPLVDIHLHSHFEGEIENNSDIRYIYVLCVIAGLVVLIACVNFINLSTTCSTMRAKEIGIRKAVGSGKARLIGQFLFESIALAFLSLMLALWVTELLRQPFGSLLGGSLSYTVIGLPWALLVLTGIPVVVGLLAGLYPAFYLASLRPVMVLGKGDQKITGWRSTRNILIIFQFAASIGLIICTLMIGRQITYLFTHDVGFDKEHVLVISNVGNRISSGWKAFKTDVMGQAAVVSASIATRVPFIGDIEGTSAYLSEGSSEAHLFRNLDADYDFTRTLGLELVAGRSFSPDFGADQNCVLLNESAVRELGWTKAVGKTVVCRENMRLQVLGVIKDFNYESLRGGIKPLAIHLGAFGDWIVLRIRSANIHDAVSMVEKKWKEYAPSAPFGYSFLDENFDSLYRTEQRLQGILGFFSIIALSIACMGLFGLVTFHAETRTKEIGIRKVLGAPVASLILMLTRQVLKWVLLANLIAWPIAWYAMNKWLQNFAYRIDLTIWSFFIAGFSALIIALFTVSWQVIRAATANPVESLRYE